MTIRQAVIFETKHLVPKTEKERPFRWSNVISLSGLGVILTEKHFEQNLQKYLYE